MAKSARPMIMASKDELSNSLQGVTYKKRKKTQMTHIAKKARKTQSVWVGIKFQPSLTRRRLKLLELAHEKLEGVGQIKFTYANMHRNLKVMLKSSVKCRYILQIQTENDIANILSWLNCEYESFSEIYAEMVTDYIFTVQLRKI